jgi:hypothetical protein
MNGSLYFPPQQAKNFHASEFLANGCLRTRIFWECTTRIVKKAYKIVMGEDGNEIRKYYTFLDEWGCPFSSFEERIGSIIVPGNDYRLEGEVAVSRGSTYLSIRRVYWPNGNDCTREI